MLHGRKEVAHRLLASNKNRTTEKETDQRTIVVKIGPQIGAIHRRETWLSCLGKNLVWVSPLVERRPLDRKVQGSNPRQDTLALLLRWQYEFPQCGINKGFFFFNVWRNRRDLLVVWATRMARTRAINEFQTIKLSLQSFIAEVIINFQVRYVWSCSSTDNSDRSSYITRGSRTAVWPTWSQSDKYSLMVMMITSSVLNSQVKSSQYQCMPQDLENSFVKGV
jgi:hypothetical protein